MPRKKTKEERPKTRPATTPEARENQLIALATDLAEQQLRDGTASNQVIVHYLRLGSTKERLEKEMLAKKTELVAAQAESVKSTKRQEELYQEALAAMREYSGSYLGGTADDEE